MKFLFCLTGANIGRMAAANGLRVIHGQRPVRQRCEGKDAKCGKTDGERARAD